MTAREILVVIDMQNDFISGALGTPEAEGIVDRVVETIRQYPTENVFATRDTHAPDYLDTQEGRNLPVPHCLKDSKGWQIHPRVADALGGARIFDKPAFGSPALAEHLAALAQQSPLSITIIGLCTDICVVSNALLIKAFLPETPLRVLSGCCAGVTPESHQAALDTMRMCQVAVQP